MTLWEPKIQPPHPSTVCDHTEMAQRILIALEKKWEKTFPKKYPCPTYRPLATNISQVAVTPGPRYEQVYATRLGAEPPAQPVPHSPCGSLTASLALPPHPTTPAATFYSARPPEGARQPPSPCLPQPARVERHGAPRQTSQLRRALEEQTRPRAPASHRTHDTVIISERQVPASSDSPVMEFGSDEAGRLLGSSLFPTQRLQNPPPPSVDPHDEIIDLFGPDTITLVNKRQVESRSSQDNTPRDSTSLVQGVILVESDGSPPPPSPPAIPKLATLPARAPKVPTPPPVLSEPPTPPPVALKPPTAQTTNLESPPHKQNKPQAQLPVHNPQPPKRAEPVRSAVRKRFATKAQLVQRVMEPQLSEGTPPDNLSIRTMLRQCKEGGSSKPSKKKKRFHTPFLSQQGTGEGNSQLTASESNIDRDDQKKYEINYLTPEEMIKLTKQIQEQLPMEICITILYRDGLCQLSKSVTESASPSGLLFAMLQENAPVIFHHLGLAPNRDPQRIHFQAEWDFVNTVLRLQSRKICYKAQELFAYLIHVFGYIYFDVSLQWTVMDPLVGCWLVNPDSPPTDFTQAMQVLGMSRPKFSCTKPEERACERLLLLSQTAEAMYRYLSERDLWRVFLDMEVPVTSILSAMEMTGICVDAEGLRAMSRLLERRLRVLQTEADLHVGGPVLLTSPHQLRRVLYEQLKLDAQLTIPMTEQGVGKSTSEAVLRLLQPLHPLPGIVLEFRHLQKVKSTYVDGIIPLVRGGKLKATWEQVAAATGRVISRDPNLQAIPKQPVLLNEEGQGKCELLLRSAFTSKPGHSLLGADFQNVELRLFAHFAKDTTLAGMFSDTRVDVFEVLARQWLGQEGGGGEVTGEQRERAKHVVYAIMYGAGPTKLQQVLHVTHGEARRLLTTFSAKFPQMKGFTQQLVRQARDQGYLTSLSGRRRLFPNICSSDFKLRAQSERQAINFLIQGSAADVCKTAMLATERAQQAQEPRPLRAKLLLQIHDELVWEVPDHELGQFTELVREAMEGTRAHYHITIPLPVHLASGKTWADLD